MSTPPFHRILVATDGGPTSERAVDLAIGLASSLGAELVTVSVARAGTAVADVEAATDPLGAAEEASAALTYDDQGAEEHIAESHAEAAAVKARKAGVAARWVTWEGAAAEGILAAADEARADVIVVGSHARGGVGRMLLGSTSDQVVRHARVPVLVVRPEAASPAG